MSPLAAETREPTPVRAGAEARAGPNAGARASPEANPLWARLATAVPAVQELVLGPVSDPLEAEADAVATRVMREPDAHAPRSDVRAPMGHTTTPSSTVAHGIQSTLGRGRSLPGAARELMEDRFRTDFSNVRVHSDGYAEGLSKQLRARAFTVGRDIYFGSGSYAPDSFDGKHLLAHELTHVVQQAGSSHLIQRLIRTPYPWQGVITPAIGARIRSSPDSSDPANIVDALPRGQTVKVTGATGDWLSVESTYRGPVQTGYIHHTLVDDAASRAMGTSVGTTMVWRGSGPGSGTDFETWASAATETPFPAVTATTVMNCWEAVLLSAYRSGALTWTWIHNLYTAIPTAGWVGAMSRGARQTYKIPGPSPMPQRGDIVFFDGIAHVALATGTGSEVYTFWPPPNTPFVLGGTTDKVKVYTIEALVTWWTAHMPPAPVVEFGAPAW